MQGRDYWNIITHNAKLWRHSTSSVAAVRVIYCVISVVYSFIFAMSPEIQTVGAVFRSTFTHWIYKPHQSFPKDFDIWIQMEVLPYAVQRTDNNCRLNEFLNSSGLLLYIWKSHKIDCHLHWHSSYEYVGNSHVNLRGSNGLFTFLIATWRRTF